MKFVSLKLVNYIGPYNGLGLNEIFIDLTKSKHKIVLIRGKNGSGKTEIFKAMNVFPDGNNKLIPGLEARKELTVLCDDIYYDIKIIYGIKKNGDRETTKAYIAKHTDFGSEELNPNGNISSYKDIIYSEFSLDASFIALSELSSVNRGLADKTPSERKKSVTSIIKTLQTYNDIYKTLSKRSSIFKSMINNITAKINNIGDEKNLKITLTSLENQLNSLMNEKDKIIETLASLKSRIQILDPDNTIQNTYNEIYTEINNIKASNDKISNKINISKNKLKLKEEISLDEIMKNYKIISDNISKLEIIMQVTESKINSLLTDKQEEAKIIQKKLAKVQTLKLDKNFDDLEKSIKETERLLSDYKQIIDRIGLCNIDNISKDEFILGVNTLKEIKETINLFKSNLDYTTISESIKYFKSNTIPNIEEVDNDIDKISNRILEIQKDIQEYSILSNISEKLSLRPTNCKINECSFIKDALEADRKNPKVKLKEANDELQKYNTLLANKRSYRISLNKIMEGLNYLKSMIRNLNKHNSILNKLPIDNILSNQDVLLDNIINGYDFSQIDKLYEYIEYSNVIDEYKFQLNKYNNLKSDYQIYNSRIKVIQEANIEIEELNEKLNSIQSEIETNSKDLNISVAKLSKFKNDLLDYDVLISLYNEKINLDNKKKEYISRFECIKSNIITIKDCINNINITEMKLNEVNKTITPLLKDRDKINHGLQLLYEYKAELKLYSEKYNKIETIKKYSSPSKGIQTLFMSLYMNKTISMSNQLLDLLFDGKFMLGEFIIDETEFRIPCIGNNITNHDISSMSTAQVCMISMILSFVMLYQSSTKYNIIKLDEIDAALDTENRIKFLNLLEKIIEMLNIEQCILISHSIEMDLSNCDIIQLKCCDKDIIENGNVIYRY